jgi:D-psicose/D-tagatose/L-ribulose 3-epimerase
MEQAAAYVKRVDHPNFGTMYDTFHANIEEKNPMAAIDTVFATGKLNHVHISENDRGTPGRGHINIASRSSTSKRSATTAG